uniref:Secreted protein n=1 Tax=Romanomermis culicivorax TaxID=13658 RepID=A0A915JLK4_ROMCU
MKKRRRHLFVAAPSIVSGCILSTMILIRQSSRGEMCTAIHTQVAGDHNSRRADKSRNQMGWLGASLRCGTGCFLFSTCGTRKLVIVQGVGRRRFRFDMHWWPTEDLSWFSFTESFVRDINITRFLPMKP